MFFLSRVVHIFFMMQYLFLQILSNKWEQNHRKPDTYYINIDYANVLKFMKIISNSTQNRQKTQNALKNKTLFFQKNRWKKQTYWTSIEQSNDNTQVMHRIQFFSSFKCSQKKLLAFLLHTFILWIFLNFLRKWNF